MLCRTCNHRQAVIGRKDCSRCAGLVRHLFGQLAEAAREIASTTLSNAGTPSPAERAAQQVTVMWDTAEAARAIKRTLCNGETEAVVTLPGSHLFTDAEIEDLGARLGCVVVRGTDDDTLLIVGYGG